MMTTFQGTGDGVTDQTAALQAAIDDCASQGGGTLLIPAGVFRTGTLFLRDHIVLELSAGSELRAVESMDAFPAHEPSITGNFNFFMRHAMIVADKVRDIGLRGQGTINGMGAAQAFARTTHEAPGRYQNRPSVIRLIDCEGVRVENIQIRDAAFWAFHLMACRDVVVHGITLKSRSPNYNCDGIDIDSCEDVRVSDCSIDSEDDAISIKGTTALPCRRIQINNCILSSHCNAIRVGAENFAGFEDIQFSNMHIHDSCNGITFQNIDGYPMRRLYFTNIHLRGVAVPVHLVTNRKTYPVGIPEEDYPIPHGPSPASIEKVVFAGIYGEELGHYRGIGSIHTLVDVIRHYPATFSGHPDAPLRGLVIRDVDLTFTEEAPQEPPPPLRELNDSPNPGAGIFPIFGLCVRHAQDVDIHHVRLRAHATEVRPGATFEHVRGADIDGLVITSPAPNPAVTLHQCGGIRFAQCHVQWDGDAKAVITESAATVAIRETGMCLATSSLT